MNRMFVCIAALLLPQFAMAVPPPNADMTFAPWYQSLTVPQNGTNNAGLSCCDVADCRPVQYRSAGDHFEAYVDSKTFPSQAAPNRWLVVPNEVVLKPKDNPTGEGVLCFFQGAVRCFVPASGT